MHTARLNLFVCLHVCLNGLYFYVLGLCVMSLLYICVRCKTLCIIGGQRDGLCPFWQPARSIFTVLLCCVFSRANKLSLSLSLSTVAVHGNMTMSQPRQFYLMIYTTKSGQHRQLKKQGKNCSAEDNTLQCN